MARPSLTRSQIRDPLGTLSVAYGVERSFSDVVEQILSRAFLDTKGIAGRLPETQTAAQIVAFVLQDGRFLGRLYRGGSLPQPWHKGALHMAAGSGSALPSAEVVQRVYNNIRTTLEAAFGSASATDRSG